MNLSSTRRFCTGAQRLLTRAMALATLSVLSACGGGTDTEPGADSAAATTMTALGLTASAGATAEATRMSCAREGSFCAFTGSAEVRYGTATRYVTKTLSNGSACSNAVFGDPAYGIVKACSYVVAAAGAPLAPIVPVSGDWVSCATEAQHCAFSGTRAVRYGTPVVYRTATHTDGTACNNAVFGDPAYGIRKSCSYAALASAAPAPAPAPAPTPTPTPVAVEPIGASGTNPPVVFNASASARAGDVISVQGENFGTVPRVYLEGAPAAALEIVDRVGTGWLAVQIPPSATGALLLRLQNATGTSARLTLNGARPMHLDTLQLVPGGAFKVFGRNLLLAGSTPRLMVGGQAARIDLARSDEHMLTALAPVGLAASAATAVSVDNGNGSGPAELDRTIEAVAAGGADPFGLGVGWGAGFSAIAATTIDAGSDSRLSQKAVCDGRRDDSGAIQSAIELAAANGGGVVRLPAGVCRMVNRMSLRSRVVVQGAGKAATEVRYEANYPFMGGGLDLAGVRNMTLTNAGPSGEGPLLKDSTRVFIQGVRVRLMTSRQMFLTGNRNFVVRDSDFEQTAGISEQGPYTLAESAGLVFEGNTTQWVVGAPTFGRVRDSYLHANRFTRDGRGQNSPGVVHSMTLEFAHRVAVVGNTFDVAHGPITNRARNDGESVLTEGGGAERTENIGSVGSAGASSLSDPSNTLRVDPFGTGVVPENYGVAIVGGKGAGQTRRVVAYSRPTLTVDRAWDVVPDSSSRYATFVWGLEKSLIKDNNFSQNPRGIWLYHTAVRDVDLIGNSMSQGGGIYLRSYQNLSTRSFMPIYNVLIARNKVVNTTGQWMSHINSVFVNGDARAFGIATIGVEMRSNELTANLPNLSSGLEEYAGTEGFTNMMRVENYSGYESTGLPRVLGSILANNSCTNCEVAVRIGTGSAGTTILNTRLVNSGVLSTDSASTSTSERATDTVIR